MHRPFSAAALAAILLVLASSTVASTPEALERARGLLARDDARAAVEVLEAALPSVSAADRPLVLQELRRAYDRAARQAESAGQSAAALAYRDNLRILDRKAAKGQDTTRPAPQESHEAEELKPPDVSRTQDPAVRRVSDGPDRALPNLARAATNDAPQPQTAPAWPDPAAVAPATAPASPADLKAADAAFRLKKYDEAGRIYAALAQANQLPKERRDHWAYCRCADVVRRINANPRTPGEWASIYAEIQSIRALSPTMWYGEYLRNLAAERANAAGAANPTTGTNSGTGSSSGGAAAASPGLSARRTDNRSREPGAIVIRGSEPEEPPPAQIVLAMDPPRALATPSAAPSRSPQPIPMQTEPSIGNWQVLSTPNFRILHANPALADRVARAAEAARDEQARRWMGQSPAAAWSPRCDIYLYSSATLFAQMTGQPEDSPGFSTMGLSGNRIIARRVNLRADHPNLVTAVLPHEVTHVVLADLFPTQQIPRWADEGMAVLAEPPSEQQLRASDLSAPLASGRVFRMQDLMTTDYPDGKYWGLYYAQSVSLTRFLVEQGTPAQFIKFLQASQRSNVETQLKQVYQIDGYADLQRRWAAHARSTGSVSTAVNEKGESRKQ